MFGIPYGLSEAEKKEGTRQSLFRASWHAGNNSVLTLGSYKQLWPLEIEPVEFLAVGIHKRQCFVTYDVSLPVEGYL